MRLSSGFFEKHERQKERLKETVPDHGSELKKMILRQESHLS
jgi:hypothetical protein